MWEQVVQLCKKCSLAVLVLSLVTVTTAYAGGFEAGNFNGEAVVNSSRIASANPAGLAVLERSEVIMTAAIINTNIEFKTDGNSNVSGNDGGEQGETLAGGGFSLAFKINPDLGLGLALTSPAGGSMDPNNDWVGRYLVQRVEFVVFALDGSIGYKVNDWLALGAGISYQHADFEQDIAIATGGADGQASIEAEDNVLGFTLGALLMPRPGTRIGIGYRSEVEYELGGNLSTTTGVASSLSTDFPLPQRLLVSLSQKVGKATVITADVGWTNFSEFDMTTVYLGDVGVSSTLPRNWDDTWRFGLAVSHFITPQTIIAGGITYDTSPMDDEDRLPDLPVDRQISLNAALNQKLDEKLSIGLGFNFVDLGKAKIDLTAPTGARLSGEYDDNNMFMIVLSAKYKF